MIYIYGNDRCSWCSRAKGLCDEINLHYQWLNTDDEEVLADLRKRIPGVRQIPQIWVDNHHVGGYSELKEFLDSYKVG